MLGGKLEIIWLEVGDRDRGRFILVFCGVNFDVVVDVVVVVVMEVV